MKTTTFYLRGLCMLALVFISVFVVSCKKDDPPVTPPTQKVMNDLVIPDNFGFETAKQVTITFQDQLKSGGTARYDVFYHSPQVIYDTVTYLNDDNLMVTEILPMYDETNDLIARKISETGFFNLIVTIPTYITELYVIKNDLGIYTSSIIQVNGSSALFKSGLKNSVSSEDLLYGVNNSGKLFSISPETGVLTMLNNLPQGSGACAIDNANRILYFVGKNPNYPLYRYDLTNLTFQLVANLKMKVQRFDYNPNDGLLYSCYKEEIYAIDPQNGNVVMQKELEEVEGSEFGDLKISPEGKWYLATYSGVFWLEFKTKEVYAHRIGSSNLPFKATGMTITSNGDMWICTHSAKSNLIKMNKATGAWEYKFNQYNLGIDDLATLTPTTAPVVDDADNDGVIDIYDEYPNDPLRAYNTYTPSIQGLGSLTFEDNWPAQGDYDFNDLMLGYKFKTVMNAADKVVELFCKFTVSHVGGVYKNGFGFQLPFNPAQVASVTGYNITSGLVTLDSKGLESGQQKAVVIVFDNADDNIYTELTIHILLQTPLEASVVGAPPFNPFIFTNATRGNEVHLINMPPTSKMNTALFGTGNDRSIPSQGKYYLTQNKLPWALNLLEPFEVPKETKPINQGYTKFNTWAESGGTDFPDWYKDNPGYRNTDFLKTN